MQKVVTIQDEEEEEEILVTTPALEALAEHARQEYRAGRTISLDEILKEWEQEKKGCA